MGVLGQWVVLNETTEETKRYFLRLDTAGPTGVTERWWRPVDISAPNSFAEDARAFYFASHGRGQSGVKPYGNANAMALWAPDAVTPVIELPDWSNGWPNGLRAYLGFREVQK
jgi:hypothetical protein